MKQGVVFRPQAEIDIPPASGSDCTAQCRRANRFDRAELQRASLDDFAVGRLTMARNTVLRLLPPLPMTLLFGSLMAIRILATAAVLVERAVARTVRRSSRALGPVYVEIEDVVGDAYGVSLGAVAIARAMRSFVRKYTVYGLAGGQGRCRCGSSGSMSRILACPNGRASIVISR